MLFGSDEIEIKKVELVHTISLNRYEMYDLLHLLSQSPVPINSKLFEFKSTFIAGINHSLDTIHSEH